MAHVLIHPEDLCCLEWVLKIDLAGQRKCSLPWQRLEEDLPLVGLWHFGNQESLGGEKSSF